MALWPTHCERCGRKKTSSLICQCKAGVFDYTGSYEKALYAIDKLAKEISAKDAEIASLSAHVKSADERLEKIERFLTAFDWHINWRAILRKGGSNAPSFIKARAALEDR